MRVREKDLGSNDHSEHFGFYKRDFDLTYRDSIPRITGLFLFWKLSISTKVVFESVTTPE